MTKAEIAEAACIIVAADTQVPMDRFAGRPVIQCKVSDGISKAEELLDRALNGNVPLYQAKEAVRQQTVRKNLTALDIRFTNT